MIGRWLLLPYLGTAMLGGVLLLLYLRPVIADVPRYRLMAWSPGPTKACPPQLKF